MQCNGEQRTTEHTQHIHRDVEEKRTFILSQMSCRMSCGSEFYSVNFIYEIFREVKLTLNSDGILN